MDGKTEVHQATQPLPLILRHAPLSLCAPGHRPVFSILWRCHAHSCLRALAPDLPGTRILPLSFPCWLGYVKTTPDLPCLFLGVTFLGSPFLGVTISGHFDASGLGSHRLSFCMAFSLLLMTYLGYYFIHIPLVHLAINSWKPGTRLLVLTISSQGPSTVSRMLSTNVWWMMSEWMNVCSGWSWKKRYPWQVRS